MTQPDDPNEINEWVDCDVPVDVVIESAAGIEKRCPIKDEVDVGSIAIHYFNATRLPELHEVNRLLDHYDESPTTHEEYTAMMRGLLKADKVVTRWRTADLFVTVTATDSIE